MDIMMLATKDKIRKIDIFDLKLYQYIPISMAKGTYKAVPNIIPNSILSPQRTPAYFL